MKRHFPLHLSILLALGMPVPAFAHGTSAAPDSHGEGRAIQFPDTADHQTLVVDLHTHSVFSDGHVWPYIRVGEAQRDGLDAMAVTEHLEYQPHIADIPHPDRNRAYQETLSSLPPGSELLIIAGSEITRRAPHGHMNAVFITDANALFNVDQSRLPLDAQSFYDLAREWPAENAVAAANAQGAFVFWNHSWSDFANEKTTITDFHREAARNGLLHGIEIANGQTYSPESFQIALDHGLTPIGVSDVHNLVDWDYEPHLGGHRPVNLVFTQERSVAAIREALMEGRTVVWFRNLLIGLEEHLAPLLDASIEVTGASYESDTSGVLRVSFSNNSDAVFELENLNAHTLVESHDVVEIPAHTTTDVLLRMDGRPQTETLRFRVLNALTAPDTHPEMRFRVQVE